MKTDKVGHKRKLDITEQYKSKFRKILLETYFANWDPAHLNSEAGERDIEDHVCGRMLDVENRVLPWVGEVYDIAGKSVLEIGCGTGSTTVPFALRVHTIHSYDINDQAVKAAKQRATLLGVDNVNFHLLDECWAQSEEGLKSFSESVPQVDIVLLMALLEHLTIEERINILRTLWEILKPGGIIIIYETPNRIFYFDWHSFWLPFFHCLPDQLALLYSVKTPRASLRVDPRGDLNENLYRIGRGVSYHEFELAFNFEDLTVINDGYSKYLRHCQPSHESFDKALLEIFEEHLPHIPRGFTRPSLDLIIRKERDRLPEERDTSYLYKASDELQEEGNRLIEQLLVTQQQLATCKHQLKTIENSYTWRLGQKIALSPLGLVALRLLQATQTVRAFAIKSWAKKHNGQDNQAGLNTAG